MMAKYGYGIDIGGTAVKMGLFTETGELLEKWDIRTDVSESGIHIIPSIAKSVSDNIERHTLDRKNILGIGMGVPGCVLEGGFCTCVNLGWNNYPAPGTLRSLTGLEVRCANDANCAALGEAWLGSGKGHKDVVMITLGTGVGGGIILNGKIHTGIHGAAGELGHIPVNPRETRLCNCGNRGCLEMYTSANGNVRLAMDYLQEVDTPSPLRTAERINSKLCWDLAIAGDPVAVEIARRFSDYLGMGLAMIANIIDPEAIIIGGGVSRTGEPLRAMVESYFRKYAFHAVRNIDISIAQLGNDAGIYGCVKMLLD